MCLLLVFIVASAMIGISVRGTLDGYWTNELQHFCLTLPDDLTSGPFYYSPLQIYTKFNSVDYPEMAGNHININTYFSGTPHLKLGMSLGSKTSTYSPNGVETRITVYMYDSEEVSGYIKVFWYQN